jgi:uncharacterized protein (UPF0548 family)
VSQTGRIRRSNHVEMPVNYAAVGASQLPDVVRFPPSGTESYAEALQLGSGQERFIAASSLLMTWGAQRGAGVTVSDVVRGVEDPYLSPEFDDRGQALSLRTREEQFGPNGEPYIVPGTSAVLTAEGRASRSVLVVYTIDEDRTAGFAWGTRDGLGVVGEQRFTVELRDDETVWAVAQGFLTSPKSGLLGLKSRALIREAVELVRKQIGALAPGAADSAKRSA